MRKNTSGYLSFITLLTVLSLLTSLFMATSVAVATEPTGPGLIEIPDYDETAHGCPDGVGFKIEGEWMEEGENLYKLYDDEDNLLFSVTLDIVFDGDDEPFTFTYSGLNAGFTSVLVKGGTSTVTYPDYPMTPNGKNRAAISHIEFCGTGTTPDPDPISINLLKVDDEEVPNALDGVSFNLTDGNGYNANATTTGGGQAAFANLPAGSYTLTETANTNEGCDTAGPWTVTVTDNQGTLSASMTDANQAAVTMSEGKFVIVNDCEEIIIPCIELTGTALRDALKLAGSDVLNAQDSDGSTATTGTATLVVPAGYCDVQVSFTSYELPGGYMLPFEDQVVFDNITDTYGPGTYPLEIDLPDCGWQIDLYTGPLQWPLNASYGHVGSTLIDWAANEGAVCEEEEATKVKLIKVDQNDNALEGVEFTLAKDYSGGGDGADRVVETDENGYAKFTDLTEGTYTLTETFNPDENCTNDGPWTVVISAEEENDQIQTLIVEESSLAVTIYDANENELELVDGRFKIVNDCEEPEEETVDLDLVKTTDADTDPFETLAGVMFNLSDGELGGYNTESTTDEDGRARFEDLTIGEYTLTEISNPHAGCVTAGPWTVTVEGEGEIQPYGLEVEPSELTITVKDNEGNELELQQDGSFRIINVCEEPEEPTREIDLIKVNQDDETLGGVTFTLEGEGVNLEATTVSDGTATFTGLGAGTYTLTETANSNEGCETAGPWTVVISANAEFETILEVAVADENSNALTANADGSFSIVNECEEPEEPKTPEKPTPPKKPGMPDTAMAVDDTQAPVSLLGLVLLLSAGVLVLNKRKELFAAGA